MHGAIREWRVLKHCSFGCGLIYAITRVRGSGV
jgi:hypothetical protein